MKDRIKLLLAVFLIIGIVAGLLLGVYWTSRNIATIKNYTVLLGISFEIEETNRAYFSAEMDMDDKIASLFHLLRYYEYLESNKLVSADDKNFLHDKVVLLGRLGILFENQGKKDLAVKYFGDGLRIVKESGVYENWKGTQKAIISVNDLKRFIKEIDERIIRSQDTAAP